MTPMIALRGHVRALSFKPFVLFASIILFLMVMIALFAPWLAPTDPYDLATLDLFDSHLPPSWMSGGDARYFLGTDSQGADIMSLLMLGLRTSLTVGLLAVGLSVLIGLTLGLLSGYFRGWIETVIMRAADIQFTFPAMLLALLIGGLARSMFPVNKQESSAFFIVVLALGISHWPHFARLVRAAVISEAGKNYVMASRLAGRGHFGILFRHVMPNSLNPVFVLATMDIAFAIMTEATLSFLGFGMPASQPSLGTLIKVGYGYLFSGEWWVVVFPSAILIILLVSVNVFGDWLRDRLDPKLR
ncbi:peptide/nickel transport system permease protein [Pacificibacter maritimus]|uniref:Peptide/nickel transport system permease protein n=1 Tax=Pacificibacter maritimus TaxID=762213 RepID=A0A3N4UNN0_9RHOB|nr:ABC transporter permease [Pacificibacter maritimus]RPE66637.1 peptide/nickel transport system permease protein [Pacificibacter maritimus]